MLSEAAGTLIHIISSRYSRQPDLVIKHELMQVLLNLLDTYSVCEKAVEELRKVASHPVNRNYAFRHGALDTLLNKLDTTNVSMMRKHFLTISKFCGGIIQPLFNKVRPAIKAFCNLVYANDDKEVLSNACKALSYLTSTLDLSFSNSSSIWGVEKCDFIDDVSESEVVDAFHEADVLLVLLKLINKYSTPSIIAPAIRTVLSISTDDDKKRICIPETDPASVKIDPKTRKEYNEADRKAVKKNYKTKKILICGIRPDEYNRILSCQSAKEIWDALQDAHEGTSK
ncbi:importin subunit alpha-1a-like [Lycium ferocissimum]|uniref:importin subunit alpha-1a-like n=1 Tax=Lycium ferocissimum TaxID=112874 RepID=UPI0028163D24|nr:importin subunit alpha-1a-like [Lycium ferocissimum]